MTWAHVPRERPHEGLPPLVIWLIVGVSAIPFLDWWNIGRPGAFRFLSILAVVLWAMVRAPRWTPGWVLLGTLACTWITEPVYAVRLGYLTMVPAAIWCIASGTVLRPYGWLPPRAALKPMVVPLAFEALALFVGPWYQAALALVAASLALGLVALAAPGRVERHVLRFEERSGPLRRSIGRVGAGLETVGRWLGEAVGAVVMVPVGVAFAVVWAVHRLLGHDPMAAGAHGGSAWVPRVTADNAHRRLYGTAEVPIELSTSQRRRRAAATSVLAVSFLAVGLVVLQPEIDAPWGGGDRAAPSECAVVADEAMDGDVGWPAIVCETDEFTSAAQYDPVTTYSYSDYDGDHLEVRDGVRTTWRAPACDCRRVRIWLFGGSGAWGFWQSTDQTWASQLAQRAWRDGIVLDIENRALPGWGIGQESRLFQALLAEEEPPDLAVFYDGGNDLDMQRARIAMGRGADESEATFWEEHLNSLLHDGPERFDPAVLAPVEGIDRADRVSPREAGRHAMARYLRTKQAIERTAAVNGVEPIFVWQPLLASSPRATGTANALEPAALPVWTELLAGALPRLPEDVVDLSRLFEDERRVIFKDNYHHNAAAAGAIADALYTQLEPMLRELSTQ